MYYSYAKSLMIIHSKNNVELNVNGTNRFMTLLWQHDKNHNGHHFPEHIFIVKWPLTSFVHGNKVKLMPITSYQIHVVTHYTLVSETSLIGFMFQLFIDHSFFFTTFVVIFSAFLYFRLYIFILNPTNSSTTVLAHSFLILPKTL